MRTNYFGCVIVMFLFVGWLLLLSYNHFWRYDMGMELEAVRKISGFEGRLTKFAIDYDGVPTLVQWGGDSVSYFVNENGVKLMFNSIDELVQIKWVRLFGINLGIAVDRLRS